MKTGDSLISVDEFVQWCTEKSYILETLFDWLTDYSFKYFNFGLHVYGIWRVDKRVKTDLETLGLKKQYGHNSYFF